MQNIVYIRNNRHMLFITLKRILKINYKSKMGKLSFYIQDLSLYNTIVFK